MEGVKKIIAIGSCDKKSPCTHRVKYELQDDRIIKEMYSCTEIDAMLLKTNQSCNDHYSLGNEDDADFNEATNFEDLSIFASVFQV